MSSPHSILFVSYEPLDKYIGLNTRLFGLARSLAKKGWRVEIVAPTDDALLPSESESDGLILHHVRVPFLPENIGIPILPRIVFVALFAIKSQRIKALRGRSFDLVQAEQSHSFPGAYSLAKYFVAKVILDDVTMLQFFVKDKFRNESVLRSLLVAGVRWFERLLFNSSNLIICSSNKTIEYVKAHLHKPLSVLFLPNGVCIDTLRPASERISRNHIFFGCSLPYYQNLSALINFVDIIEQLNAAALPPFSATIVVNDIKHLSMDLQERIRKIANITLHCKVASMGAYLQAADFSLLPYSQGHFLTAGSRLKAVEALACGNLVLSTPEGIDGVDGCVPDNHYIACPDTAVMVSTLTDLIRNRDQYNQKIDRIKRNARELIIRAYSWDALTELYDKLLWDVVNEKAY